MLLATSGLALQDWPGVARWAGEERLRNQLQKMGVPSKPMVPLGGRVVVKTKRWHKQGPLAPPFKSMVLMGPSPNMTNGWVLRDGKNVQHARAVVCPAESGETAVMELYDASTRRVTGKQPPYVEDRKVPQPLQHDGLPQLLQGDLGAVGDSNDVWGEAGNADQGEDVMSLAYSPDEMPQDQLHEGDEHGSEKEMPALLRAVWAGGECNPTSMETPRTSIESLPSTTTSAASSKTLWECGSCGLLQPGEGACQFCDATTTLCSSSRSGLQGEAATTLCSSSQSGSQGEAATALWSSSQSGLQELASLRANASPELELCGEEGVRAWESVEINNPKELLDGVYREHWGWKTLWEQELAREAVGAEMGLLHGQWLQYLEDQVQNLEEELAMVDDVALRRQAKDCRLAALSKEVNDPVSSQVPLDVSDPPGHARAVLQTYTVSLAEVKRDIALWKEPLQAELEALVNSGTIRRVKLEQLACEPGYDRMEVAPAKVVPTIKSPSGKRKARIVICGNMVHPAGHVKAPQLPDDGDQGREDPHGDLPLPSQGPGGRGHGSGGDRGGGSSQATTADLYAGGVDATALRCVLRKSAGEGWSLASTDVRGAFLLAPRSQSRRQLLVVEPPRLLTSTGLVGLDERWICDGAMYGLDTSPADWATFRDRHLGTFRWETQTHRCHLARSPEPNIWSIMGVPKEQYPTPNLNDDAYANPLGFLIVYVDDVLCAGPREVVESTLARVRKEWTCSEVEWVGDTQWLKFCGMQLRWQGDTLLLGQPDFARELLERHGPVPGRQVPLPKIDLVPEEEESPDPDAVKQCQQLLGELLWLSGRTRPDLAFAISTLSGWVTRCPRRVKELGRHVLGYLQETVDMVLSYGSCLDDQGQPNADLRKVTLLSDASHAPQGLRGCQGILALWGNALVQWESRRQPFAALSSTEAELIGYVDALTMGESLQVILNVLEHNDLVESGQFEIRGDNLSGIQLLLAPDGPWRTRHLRLRSFVLRERLAAREWRVQHTPGSELAADLLTKPVVLMTSWEVFRRTVGLVRFVQPTESSRLCRLTEAVVALGGLMLQHGASSLVKTAGAVSLSALTAWMCCMEGLASMAKPVEEKKEPRPAQNQEKRPRENEPGPTNPTEPTYDCSLTGSPTVPRLCALRGQAMAAGPLDGPWNGAEFQGMPTGSNDRWRSLPQGWWVRVHGGLRSRLYHPVHTTTPVRCEDLEPERTTVIWHCPNGRPWTRMIHQDAWGYGSQPIPGVEQWKGFTFFRIQEGNPAGGNSSGLRRLRPDVVTWGFDDEPLPTPVQQAGVSSAHPPPAGVPPTPRGDGYRAPTAKMGGYQAPVGPAADPPRGRPGPGERGRAVFGKGAPPARSHGEVTAAGRTTMGAGPMGGSPEQSRDGGNPLLASLRAARISENPGGPSSSSLGSTSIPGAWTASGDPGVATPRGSVAKSWAHKPELVVHTLSAPYCAERRVEPPPEGLEEESFQEEAVESEEPSDDEYSEVTDVSWHPAGTPENEEEDM